ncbi:GNAT family N-acetyltransferase [Musicola paradisiaca]|uniref:GCN5-related N-acetyltransferase n=1 Tax=Musicola paradisiaca (strain Ech703) TaxID=579405 RepID=C6C7B5_MUSP7|nr:GNAT family N-acetyltransferase [Musicola paradisiaca]ACS84033.1 GCN5-related N-acetyltransferase [Musicola paradisiaca Ech703]
MSTIFRQVTLADDEAFLELALAAYAPVREMGIKFDAAYADIERIRFHIQHNGVYVMEKEGRFASSCSIRYPWGPEPGPFGLPHIGWFATHPDFKQQGLGRQMLDWLEQDILLEQLKAPAVSLGTAKNHPWLLEMYRNYGFKDVCQADLGKGHLTIFMEKVLDPQRYDQWKKKHPRAEI